MPAADPSSVPDPIISLPLLETGRPSGARAVVAHTEAAPMPDIGQGIAGSQSVRLNILIRFLTSWSTS